MTDTGFMQKVWRAKKVLYEQEGDKGNFVAIIRLWEEGGGLGRRFFVVYWCRLEWTESDKGMQKYYISLHRAEELARNGVTFAPKEDALETTDWLAKVLFGPDVERNPNEPVEVTIPPSVSEKYVL